MLNIEDLAARTGLKRDEFARKIGVTRQVVNRYAKGETVPRVDTAWKIVNTLREYGIFVDFMDLFPNPEAGKAITGKNLPF